MSEPIAITNVKVFDGNALTEERTVVIENGLISPATTADRMVDGQHGTLLPGFIDCHVHLASLAELKQGTQWGNTTMLDMGSQSMAVTNSLRHRQGLADIRGAGNVASAPGGMQTTRMGFPASSAVTGPADASRFVAERVVEGSDYISLMETRRRILLPHVPCAVSGWQECKFANNNRTVRGVPCHLSSFVYIIY